MNVGAVQTKQNNYRPDRGKYISDGFSVCAYQTVCTCELVCGRTRGGVCVCSHCESSFAVLLVVVLSFVCQGKGAAFATVC